MTIPDVSSQRQLEVELAADRPRLVALCTSLTGNRAAAEDLTQETLVEAWRHRDRIYDAEGLSSWTSAIARNVYRRWARELGRQQVVSATSSSFPDRRLTDADPVDPECELEVELERCELAELLDRAMAALTPQARAVLIQRYVEDLPHAEIAERLGLTEGAVRITLHRGKLALKRILTTDLQEDAVAHGLIEPEAAAWQETRIWCPLCGTHRFQGRLDQAESSFELRCPDCYPATGAYTQYVSTVLFEGIGGYKAAFNRAMRFVGPFYQEALKSRGVHCPNCPRGRMSLHLCPPPEAGPSLPETRGMHLRCQTCRSVMSMRLSNLVLYQPAAWEFWRHHPRIRILPERSMEAGGRSTLVLSYQSLSDAARLDALVAGDTYEILSIHHILGA